MVEILLYNIYSVISHKCVVVSGELHVHSIPAVQLAPMSRPLYATSAVYK